MGIDENLSTMPDWDQIEEMDRQEAAFLQREKERKEEAEMWGVELPDL